MNGEYLIRKAQKAPSGRALTVYAHRGASEIAPENTIAALELAKAHGATQVEFDVRLTQDGVPVVFHDATLDRTTSGQGYVSRSQYSAIAVYDAGSWFDEAFSNEKVPLLSAYLETAARLHLYLNIELKVYSQQQCELMALLLSTHLQAHWPDSLQPPLVSSSNLYALKCVRKQSGHQLPLALISDNKCTAGKLLALSDFGLFSVHHRFDVLNKAYVESCHQNNLKVMAYTVNDSSTAQSLVENNVDGIFTDRVGLYSFS